MIKKTTLVTSVVLLSSFAMLSSCSKSKDNNTDQLASLGKATIKGKVTAPLSDTTISAQYAPAGTVINAWVDTRDFVLYDRSSDAYANRYYTTTVDASGNYTLTVDVSKYKPATIHIEPAQFEFNFITRVGGTIRTTRKVYNALSGFESVTNGGIAIRDIAYTF